VPLVPGGKPQAYDAFGVFVIDVLVIKRRRRPTVPPTPRHGLASVLPIAIVIVLPRTLVAGQR